MEIPNHTPLHLQSGDLQSKIMQLESDNQLLLQSKINLGKQVQDLTDELIELREKYASRTEPEEVKVTSIIRSRMLRVFNRAQII